MLQKWKYCMKKKKKPNNNKLQTFKESLLSSVSVQVKIQVHVRWSLLSKRHRLHRRYNSLNEIVGIRLLLPPAPNCNYLMSSWISTLMLCFDMGCFQTVLCLCLRLCHRLCRLHQLWNVPSLSLCQVFSCGTFCWMSFFLSLTKWTILIRAKTFSVQIINGFAKVNKR